MTISLERPKKTRSAAIREQLGYPVIDTDVHTQEFEPAFLDYLEQVGGSAIVDKFREQLPGVGRFRWFSQTWKNGAPIVPLGHLLGSSDKRYTSVSHDYAAQVAPRTVRRSGN